MGNDPEIIECNSRLEWRNWLEKNYEVKNEVWLLFYKKSTGKQVMSYDDALEEALCFGWIDSRIKNIDDECYAYRYTPRKKKSQWSEKNKLLALKLINNNKMTPPGLEIIDWLEE